MQGNWVENNEKMRGEHLRRRVSKWKNGVDLEMKEVEVPCINCHLVFKGRKGKRAFCPTCRTPHHVA